MTIPEILQNWRAALEIIILAVGIYYALMFVRGTRGWPVVLGFFILLLAITVLTTALHLRVLLWLLAKLLTGLAIAVLVIFQPELRRAIMRLGETRLFRGFSSQVSEEIEQLVQSAIYLSKRKIGALIAIERSTGLGGIAESGTRVNADLSAKMLNTIFYPNSPLHDLGVIVSQGRIAYAGVEFPLAEEGTVERDLGSRHRAAVGLSR